MKSRSEAAVPEVPPVSRTACRSRGRRGLRRRRPAGARSRDTSSRGAASAAWPHAVARRARAMAACCSPKPAPAPARRWRYLVPAILSGQRVLVSTGTKNLQEQIYFKDLPALASGAAGRVQGDVHEGPRQLPVPAPARSSSARAHRLAELLDAIAAWAETTETGDRAELDDLPDDSRSGATSRRHAETCLGTDCPQYQQCFVTRMRQRAAESDLVDRQSSPALRGCRRAAELVRRGHPRVSRTWSSTKRTSSRTSPPSTSACRSAITASRIWSATASGS